MGDAGNALPLLIRQRRQQRSRRNDQNALQLPLLQPLQKMAVRHCRRAAAAAGARNHVLLPLPVVNHQPAVGELRLLHGDPFLGQKLLGDGKPDRRQIPCDNKVVMSRGQSRIAEMGGYRISRGRRHGRPHIEGVLEPQIHNLADCGRSYNRAAPGPVISRNDRAARAGNRVLGRRGLLRAVLGGVAELLLHRAVMACGSRKRILGSSGIYNHGSNC
ncbi:hypothetical protein D3C73_1171130 [compost metagenome]